MIRVEIPGREPLDIAYVVMDYNGTVAVDGLLPDDVAERIGRLSGDVEMYVLTADTFGTVAAQCASLDVHVETFPREGAAECKERVVDGLLARADGAVVCLGNGLNDIRMFDCADLSIAIIGQEGACAALLAHADVVVTSPVDALDLLLKPGRLKATLRS